MKKTIKMLCLVVLCALQASVSSCYISTKALNQWHYSSKNLNDVINSKRFYLVALNSISHDNWPVEFEAGSVCLVINGLGYRFWAVKDEFPWQIQESPDASSWKLFDLAKPNWKDKQTFLTQGDPRMSQYQSAISQNYLNTDGTVSVLDLRQVYENIENCFGIILVGKERCYYFHNRLNFNLHSHGLLYQAFFHDTTPFPHTVLAESNDLADIEKTAREFADKNRNIADEDQPDF